jgi:hypothetical protein
MNSGFLRRGILREREQLTGDRLNGLSGLSGLSGLNRLNAISSSLSQR